MNIEEKSRQRYVKGKGEEVRRGGKREERKIYEKLFCETSHFCCVVVASSPSPLFSLYLSVCQHNERCAPYLTFSSSALLFSSSPLICYMKVKEANGHEQTAGDALSDLNQEDGYKCQ